ncbi:MAG: hypothetical protein LBQ88_16695 [Treponema sp.]|jgi:hypothetical protein|nr:hypothetical protein [Treponema sp.]
MTINYPAAETAYITAQGYFSKAVLPFGAGVVVAPDTAYARRSLVHSLHCICD